MTEWNRIKKNCSTILTNRTPVRFGSVWFGVKQSDGKYERQEMEKKKWNARKMSCDDYSHYQRYDEMSNTESACHWFLILSCICWLSCELCVFFICFHFAGEMLDLFTVLCYDLSLACFLLFIPFFFDSLYYEKCRCFWMFFANKSHEHKQDNDSSFYGTFHLYGTLNWHVICDML